MYVDQSITSDPGRGREFISASRGVRANYDLGLCRKPMWSAKVAEQSSKTMKTRPGSVHVSTKRTTIRPFRLPPVQQPRSRPRNVHTDPDEADVEQLELEAVLGNLKFICNPEPEKVKVCFVQRHSLATRQGRTWRKKGI